MQNYVYYVKSIVKDTISVVYESTPAAISTNIAATNLYRELSSPPAPHMLPGILPKSPASASATEFCCRAFFPHGRQRISLLRMANTGMEKFSASGGSAVI